MPGKVLLLGPDMHGLIIDRDGSDDFFRYRQPSWTGAGTGDGDGGKGRGGEPEAGPPPDRGGRLFDFDGDR